MGRTHRGANSVQGEVELLFQTALDQAFPGLKELPIVTPTKPKDAKFGDYQCNNAMKLFNSLRGKVALHLFAGAESHSYLEGPKALVCFAQTVYME